MVGAKRKAAPEWVGETKPVSSLSRLSLVNVSVIKRLSNPWSLGCVRECGIFIFLIKAAKVVVTLFFLFNAHTRKCPQLLVSSSFSSAQQQQKKVQTSCILFPSKNINKSMSEAHTDLQLLGLISTPEMTPLKLTSTTGKVALALKLGDFINGRSIVMEIIVNSD